MKKIGLLMVIVLAVAWFFNPDLRQHKEQIADSYGSGLARGLARLAIGVGGLQYHNYLLFSTTTDAGEKTLSIGLLGKVVVLQK